MTGMLDQPSRQRNTLPPPLRTGLVAARAFVTAHGPWVYWICFAALNLLLFLPLGIFLGFQCLLTVTPEDRAPGRREK